MKSQQPGRSVVSSESVCERGNRSILLINVVSLSPNLAAASDPDSVSQADERAAIPGELQSDL